MRPFYVCAVLCLASVSASASAAKSVVLQTVDLNDKGMSTEGGEAKLLRVSTGKRTYCRITAIHYGETGKATYGFAFEPRLFSAVTRQYRYAEPIYVNPRGKVVSTRTETLETKSGSATLRAAFDEYRSFFDAGKLAQCSQR